ncbi:MAG: ATP-dependent Clp protease adapter ClpS [Verrucomicrobia bacterium]|nr:ATP-dependent Clp protease adapter ClpS [Verrucomicrobiota bacterium]
MQIEFEKPVFQPRSSSGGTTLLPELDENVELGQPWQVVVHNDPVNLMTYVVKVFIKVFGFSRETAEKHMWEVHKKGRSVVWSGERERAELYVQQLHSYLLLATLEQSL